jgi:putative ABC transport system permease protein
MYNQEKAARGEYPYNLAHVQAPLTPIVKEEISEAEYVTRITDGPAIVQGNEKIFNETITKVDRDFFRIFSFPVVRGGAARLFKSPYEVVITEDIAVKYFGSQDPIGKMINIKADTALDYIISGIVQNPPANSSLDFDILVPLEGQPSLKKDRDNWGGFRYATFVQLREDAVTENFVAKLNRIPAQHMAEKLGQFEKHFKAPEGEKAFSYRARQLSGIHYTKIFKGHKVSDPQYLGAGLIHIFVLLNRQYVGFALMSFVISIPFSLYLMNEWLANFKFRISPDCQVFTLSAAAGILLTVLAVSYHGIRSALINPADTLKHE